MVACRILLVDDSRDYLDSAERFLALDPELEVVGRAETGRTALGQVERLRPDLVLMDIAMPEMNGLEATRLLKAQLPCPRVIIVTMHEGAQYEAAARDAGADGFLCKRDFIARCSVLIRDIYQGAAATAAQGEAQR